MRRFWCCLLIVGLLGCGGGEKSAEQSKEAQVWLEQGIVQFQQQDYDAAMASFNKAAELDPKSAVTHNMLGMTYRFKYNQVRSQELKEREIAAFEKAIEADPNYWVAVVNLGATHYHLGDKGKAAPLFKRALELNPQHPEKEELLRIIAEGGQQP
jgi:Tfp pilus assembly protein PilF